MARQGIDGAEFEFARLLVEDRNNEASSYVDWLVHVHRAIQMELAGQRRKEGAGDGAGGAGDGRGDDGGGEEFEGAVVMRMMMKMMPILIVDWMKWVPKKASKGQRGGMSAHSYKSVKLSGPRMISLRRDMILKDCPATLRWHSNWKAC